MPEQQGSVFGLPPLGVPFISYLFTRFYYVILDVSALPGSAVRPIKYKSFNWSTVIMVPLQAIAKVAGPDLVSGMEKLGAVAAVQPSFVPSDATVVLKRLRWGLLPTY